MCIGTKDIHKKYCLVFRLSFSLQVYTDPYTDQSDNGFVCRSFNFCEMLYIKDFIVGFQMLQTDLWTLQTKNKHKTQNTKQEEKKALVEILWYYFCLIKLEPTWSFKLNQNFIDIRRNFLWSVALNIERLREIKTPEAY